MAKIQYLLQSKSDSAPIYLQLSLGRGKVFKRKTGLNINPKDWSKSTALPKQNNPTNKNLTTDLMDLTKSILKKLNDSSGLGIEISGEWLIHNIDLHFKRVSEDKQSELLTDAIQNIIDNASTRENGKGGVGLSKSRINGYTNLKKIVELYQKKVREPIKIKNVDLNFKRKFVSYMQKLNYSDSYTQKKVSDIKTVCLDAQINGIETSPQLPKVSGKKLKNDFVIYLTEKEIEDIKNLTIENKALENARKWLLLGCMIGQRGNDLLRLNEENIVHRNGLKLVELIQQKGNKNVIIPFSPDMEDLLKDGFPYKINIQKFNGYLKDICKLAKINELTEGLLFDPETKQKVKGKYKKWELISSHVLRRTFASNFYGKMPTPLIMSITGHATEKTFLIYIGKTADNYAQQIAEYYAKQSFIKEKDPRLKVVKKASNQ